VQRSEGNAMYDGKMMEDLMAAVERAEEHAHLTVELRKSIWNETGSSTHIYESTPAVQHMAVR
jgi:hypothetical protein